MYPAAVKSGFPSQDPESDIGPDTIVLYAGISPPYRLPQHCSTTLLPLLVSSRGPAASENMTLALKTKGAQMWFHRGSAFLPETGIYT